jgi:hypothetical protein
MKFRTIYTPVFITVLILAMVVLAACQLSSGSQTAPQAPAEQGTPYVVPEIVDTPLPAGGIPYPELQDGAQASWEQAQDLILKGQVTKLVQTHDLKVYLTLKDGRTLVATQQTIDDILKLVEICGDPCKDIKVATE